MGILKKVVPITFLIILVMCGIDKSNEDLPGYFSNTSPGSSTPPVPGPGTSVGANSTYPTSTGGSITLTKIFSLSLQNSHSYYALKGDASENLYFYSTNDLGGGVKKREVATVANGSSSFVTLCSILDDGAFGPSFDLDNTYFYFFRSPGNKIRRFNRSNCAEDISLSLPVTVSFDFFTPPLSKDNNLFYWVANNGKYIFDPSSGLVTAWSASGTIGTETFSLYQPVAVLNGAAWKYGNCSYSGSCLWKLTTPSTLVGWVKTPIETYTDLQYGEYDEFQSVPINSSLILTSFSGKYTGKQNDIIVLFYFDLSKF